MTHFHETQPHEIWEPVTQPSYTANLDAALRTYLDAAPAACLFAVNHPALMDYYHSDGRRPGQTPYSSADGYTEMLFHFTYNGCPVVLAGWDESGGDHYFYIAKRDLLCVMQPTLAEVTARVRAALLAQGFTHRVHATIHPAKGDPYQITMDSRGPLTDADIQSELRKRYRSRVVTDYVQTEI